MTESTAPIIKLTDLPVGTVIRDEDQGNYELIVFGMDGDGPRVWMEVYPHCVDCGELVAEENFPPGDTGTGILVKTKAHEFFSNWSVVLVPPLISEDLLDQINKFNEAKIARPHNR